MCSATFNIFSVAYAFVSDSVSFFFKAPTIRCWFMLLFFVIIVVLVVIIIIIRQHPPLPSTSLTTTRPTSPKKQNKTKHGDSSLCNTD